MRNVRTRLARKSAVYSNVLRLLQRGAGIKVDVLSPGDAPQIGEAHEQRKRKGLKTTKNWNRDIRAPNYLPVQQETQVIHGMDHC